FDIVVERFMAHFSHLAHQTPTLSDLVMEKMKPDEDFFHFANRWQTMASQSSIVIPESKAVTMLVHNTVPQLRDILMLSDFRTFPQLYNWAKMVQTQIRESSMPVPTTEDPIISQLVSTLHGKLDQPNRRPDPAPTPAPPKLMLIHPASAPR